MRDNYFRYIFKNGSDLKTEEYSLNDIEYSVENDIDYFKTKGFELIARQERTEVTDANGNMVYEGDILLIKGKNEYEKEVVFQNGQFGVRTKSGRSGFCSLQDLITYRRKFRVIGNSIS